MRRLSVITLLAALMAAACTASAGAKQYGPYRFDFKLMAPQTVQVTVTFTGTKPERWASISYSVSGPDPMKNYPSPVVGSYKSRYWSKMRKEIDHPADAVGYRTVTFAAGPQVHGTKSVFTVTVTDRRASHGYCLMGIVSSVQAAGLGDGGQFCKK